MGNEFQFGFPTIPESPTFTPLLTNTGGSITEDTGVATLTLADTDYLILASNSTRQYLEINNTSATGTDIYVNVTGYDGGLAYASGDYIGVLIPAGGARIFDVRCPNTAVHAATETAGATLFVVEG